MIRTSEHFGEVAKAFSAAQAEFPVIKKNKEVKVEKDGRHLYTFYYADLSSVIESIRPAFAKNQLSYTQSLYHDEKLGEGYITRIIHSSGQWFDTGFVPAIISDKAGMKDVAGNITYGKRLSLSQALGISIEDDLDAPSEKGESVSSFKNASRSQQRSSKPQGAQTPTNPSKGEKPADPPQPQSSPPNAAPNWPKDYVLPKGQFAGKKLKDIDAIALEVYYGELVASTRGKVLKADEQQMMNQMREFLFGGKIT